MKRYGHLFEQFASLENLDLAERKARKGKANRPEVRKFLEDRDGNLRRLRESLLDGSFRTSAYHNFIIHEPKERMISRLPYYPDRIVHHAILNVLEKIWVSQFTSDTYSCIKGRGIHACAEAVKHALATDPEGTVSCLKLDVRKFYPSIDHPIMKEILRRKLKDGRMLEVLDELIDSVPEGMPIGNYPSSYFANLYLSRLDHGVKQKAGIKHYFRYADDMVLLSDSKEKLHAALAYIRMELAAVKLTVKDNWQIFPVDARGIDFVGYVFRHGRTDLRKCIKMRMLRKVDALAKRGATEEEARIAMAGHWGWLKHCDNEGLILSINKKIGYENLFRREAA